jgi:hypothetical protein
MTDIILQCSGQGGVAMNTTCEEILKIFEQHRVRELTLEEENLIQVHALCCPSCQYLLTMLLDIHTES